MTLRSIGREIRRTREIKGVSRSTLAKRIGRSSCQVSRIEAGRCDISILLVLRIASALRVDLPTLVDAGGR